MCDNQKELWMKGALWKDADFVDVLHYVPDDTEATLLYAEMTGLPVVELYRRVVSSKRDGRLTQSTTVR